VIMEKLKLVRGSGNVFRDFGDPNPDLEQARAILAAKIIGILDQRKLTVRAAEVLTGVAASEFSRIRNVKLERFTIDRMITILGKLGQDVELTVTVQPRRKRTSRDAPSMARKPRRPIGPIGTAARQRSPG
jgi:predicted XRE-type DNA-binding protein